MSETSRLIRAWMEAGEIAETFYDPTANACTLPVGGGAELAVFGIPDADDVFVAVDLMRIERNSEKSELFALCMAMNAYAVQTRGGSVGFDAEREKLVLTYRIAAALIDAEVLARIVGNLIEAAGALRRRLADVKARQDRAFDFAAEREEPMLLKG